MLVTGISKVKNSVKIVLDEDQKIFIRYEVFLKSRLRKGDEINEEFISSLIEQNKYFWAKESALRLLALRTHSELELRRKLMRKKYENEIIDKIVSEMKDYGYLDDSRFAKEYFDEKVVRGGLGINRIKIELRQKGVDKEIIETLISGNSYMDQTSQAMKTAEKKFSSLTKRNYDKQKIRRSLLTFLISRGFDYDISRNIVNKLVTDSERGDE